MQLYVFESFAQKYFWQLKKDTLLSRKTEIKIYKAKFDARVAGRLSGRRAAWRRQGRREKEEDVWRADD